MDVLIATVQQITAMCCIRCLSLISLNFSYFLKVIMNNSAENQGPLKTFSLDELESLSQVNARPFKV